MHHTLPRAMGRIFCPTAQVSSRAHSSRHALLRRWTDIVCRARSLQPSGSTEVMQWAQQEFRREVAWSKPDSLVHLAEACLLVALEEEAAELAQDTPHAESLASPSAWNLERLDALAAEVSAHFRHTVAPGLLAGTIRHSSYHYSMQEELSSASAAASPSGGAGLQLSYMAEELPGSEDVFWAELGSSAPSSSQLQQRCVPGLLPPDIPEEQAAAGMDMASLPAYSSEEQAEVEQVAALLARQLSEVQVHALMQQYPVQALSAVNTVMFDRHGYRAGNSYGIPYMAQLSAVMEYGIGNSAALSILYMEVCMRLGLPMSARPVEGGRYMLIWPAKQPFSIGGRPLVIDPYGGGALMTADEACELFGLALPQLLQPASRRQLLASLLVDLRDCHWARAAGCSAKPAFMTPLDMDTALGDRVAVRAGSYSISRALAAAEKRLLLLPDDRDARLEYALLLYTNRQYDESWLQLGILQEQQVQEQLRGLGEGSCMVPEDKVALLQEKIWMMMCMRDKLTSRLPA